MIVEINDRGSLISNILNISKYDILAVDTETDGLNPRQSKVLSLQIATPDNDIYVIHGDSELIKLAIEYIEDKKLIMHNSKFDVAMLYTNTGILLKNLYCTMLAERIITSGLGGSAFISLSDLVAKYCNEALDKSLQSSFENQKSALSAEQVNYAARDVKYLFEIYNKQLEQIKIFGLEETVNLENKLTPVIVMIENTGVKLDINLWNKLSEEAENKAKEKAEEILNLVVKEIIERMSYTSALDICLDLGITSITKRKRDVAMLASVKSQDMIAQILRENLNLNSHTQVKNVLSFVFGLNIEDTNEKTINKYIEKYPIIAEILKYREYKKSESSFGSNLLRFVEEDGRIHTTYNQLGAVTGRMSSENPNLQNIKREAEYRRPFVAAEGYVFICADYSQQELRIMADISKEFEMINAFNNGVDLHALTASKLFSVPIENVTPEQRSKAKGLNFGVIYGISPAGLFRNFGIKVEEGEKYLETFFKESYPTFGKFYSKVGSIILNRGYSSTLIGRKRFFNRSVDDDMSITRKGINMIIQGTGADIIKYAMCKIFYENPWSYDDLHTVLQVHDEIVVEVKKEIAEEGAEFVKKCMLDAEGMFLKYVKPEVSYRISEYWLH